MDAFDRVHVVTLFGPDESVSISGSADYGCTQINAKKQADWIAMQ